MPDYAQLAKQYGGSSGEAGKKNPSAQPKDYSALAGQFGGQAQPGNTEQQPPQQATEQPQTEEGRNLYQRFQDWQKRTGRRLFGTDGRQGAIDEAIMSNPVGRTAAESGAGIGRSVSGFFDSVVTEPVNEVIRQAGGEDQFFEGVENYLNRTAGMDQPFMKEGLGRDIVKTGSELAPAAVATGSALRQVAQRLPAATTTAPATTTQGVVRQMGASTPAQDLAYGSLSASGGEIGEEFGGAPGRIAGSVVAPLTAAATGPAAKEGIRQIFRGGEAGRQAVAQTVDDFTRAGATPTVGEATGRPSLQAMENISGKFIGGGAINRAKDATTRNIQTRLSNVADDISPRAGEELSGLTIRRGITGNGGFVDRFRATSAQLWNRVDDAIGEETPVALRRTREALDDLVSDTDVGQVLNNPLLVRVRDALADTANYRELRALRSMVGERLASRDLISDIPRTQLRRLYGAISQDIGNAAARAGDDVANAFTRANRYTAAGHQRMDDFLQGVTNKAELDKIFSAVTKGGEGSQVINSFKRSMRPEEWEVVVANTVRRLGRPTAGQQDAAGELFSVQKFLTDWNKLGPAKRALFSGSPRIERYGQDLNAISRAAERIKFSGREAANPSGSGQFVANIGTATTGAGAVVTGNVPLLGSVLTAVTANNLGSRLMTNPHFVRALARQTRSPSMSYPGLMAGLADAAKKSDIDDAVAINSLMEQIDQQQRAGETNGRANQNQ